jgi:hypothetical protein
MIPVTTTTKTDKSAIDLAGVEAGEKMLVFWAVEPLGSSAQSNLADQNIRSAIRHEQHSLDFILRANIYLLPLKTELLPQRRTIRSSNDLLGCTAHGIQEFVMGLQVVHL